MGRRLFVGNLSYSTTEETLRAHFAVDGRNVASVRIMTDRETGRPRGFGFVDMATDEEASAAVRDLDGSQLDGRVLRVSEANDRPRTDRPDRPDRPERTDRERGERPPRSSAPRESFGGGRPRPAPRTGGDFGGAPRDDDRGRERGRESGKDRPRRRGGEDDDWGGRRGGKRGRRPELDDDYDDEW